MSGNPIKIFVCCHKNFDIVPPLCIPVQGGAAINPPLKGAVPDVGEKGEISSKNPHYCELTVQYYAWKNIQSDYYGFCHYRRFFCFDDSVRKPYLVLNKISDTKQKRYFKTEKQLSDIIKKYDIVVPKPENMGVPVDEYYNSSKYHFKRDLDLFLEILSESFPELSYAAQNYISQTRQYFCNMFIMKKEIFFGYCDTLFFLLSEFDKRKKLHGCFSADRTDGYLGERFLGIYLTYLGDNVSVLELPRIDTGCALKKRIGCAVLPPESRARLFVRKLINHI